MKEPLPEILPADPLPLVARWLEEATPVVKSATATALATVASDGRPTVRMVICRGFDPVEGWFVFYTDRESVKGQALEQNPRAAVVFHWDVFERQIRVEGPVTRAPEADSERYWSTRPLDARIAAVKRTHGADVPRPPRWGGYRIWAERVELWVGQPGRAHDRAAWTRALEPTGAAFTGGSWRGTRLQP